MPEKQTCSECRFYEWTEQCKKLKSPMKAHFKSCDKFKPLPEQTNASEVFGEITVTRPTDNNLAAVQAESSAISANHIEAIKAIGRLESAQFYETVSQKIIAETAIKMKEGKQYKGLSYVDKNGNTKRISHFEEFCEQFLGKTARRVQQIMQNYNLLGAELYEQAEQLGFKQTDYNALKALSDDDKKTLEETKANAGELEKDRLIETMESLLAKSIREKEKAKEETETAKLEIKAKDKLLVEKDALLKTRNQENDQLKIDLGIKKAKEQAGEIPPEAAILQEMDNLAIDVMVKIKVALRQKFKMLSDLYPEGYPTPEIELAMAQKIGLIISTARVLADDYAIQPVEEVEFATDDPAKIAAEEFLRWNEEQNTLNGEAADDLPNGETTH